MRRLAVVCAVLGLATAGTALADHQEPQKRLTKADNARALAMLLRASDLPGFQAQPPSPENAHVSCAPSVSETDLTLTGEAEGRAFAAGPTVVASAAHVYQSRGDATASWRRGTSAAGVACTKAVVRKTYAAQGVRVVSVRRIAFPAVSERTVAYRVRLSAATPQGAVEGYLDLVAQLHVRAIATVLVGQPLAPPRQADEVRLARIVAGRMKTAMRGS